LDAVFGLTESHVGVGVLELDWLFHYR